MQLRYVFTELGQGLRRNLSMHLAVVLTLFVSLTLVGLGVMLKQQADLTAKYFGNQLQITVFLCRAADDNPACTSEVTDVQKQAIAKVVEDSPDVESWYVESKAEAFAKAKELFGADRLEGEDAIITEADMAESVWITLEDPDQVDVVKESVVGLDGVSNVRDAREVIGPILSAMDKMTVGAWGTAVFLVVAALLLVANTIRLAAYARRKEIGIMRLVGASTLYIALPFLLEALVTAVVGVAMAIGALTAFTRFALLDGLAKGYDLLPWIGWSEFGVAALLVAILGPLLTLVPTLLLTGKYLKV